MAEKKETNEEELVQTSEHVQEQLRDYIAQEELENEDLTATLYKYDDNKGRGRKQKTICYQYGNEVPEFHDVGVKFGSGRYILMCTFSGGKKKFKSFTFKLHENYDKIKSNLHGDENQLQQVHNNNDDRIIAMMQQSNNTMMTLLMKLIESNGHQKQQVPLIPDFSSMMGNMMESYNDFALRQMDSQMDFQRKVLANSDNLELNTDEDKKESFLDIIAPMLEQYLPVLLGQKGATQKKIAVTALKGNKDYKELLKNPEELRKVLEHVEKTQGREAALKLMKNLGIDTSE